MREPKEQLPVLLEAAGAKLQGKEIGPMFAAFFQVPEGTDFTPLLEGLPGNMCQCPHWGYMLEGKVRVRYADGKEEVTEAGQVFYWPAGHTVKMEKDAKYVDFSPAKEMQEVLNHVIGKVAAQK